jgi:hypothetical protein
MGQFLAMKGSIFFFKNPMFLLKLLNAKFPKAKKKKKLSTTLSEDALNIH